MIFSLRQRMTAALLRFVVVRRAVHGMQARYPLLDHLHDRRGVYRDLGPLEAFWVVD